MPADKIYMPEDHMEELYNSKNFLVRFVHRQRLAAIVKNMPAGGGWKILDAGCGEGHLLEKMGHKNSYNHYYGLDLTTIALDKARQRCPGAQFKAGQIKQMDWEDNFFDFISCTETLEHIKEYPASLQELKRVLKPGGKLLITFPNEFWWTVARLVLGRRPIKVVDHFNAFSPGRMTDYVRLKNVSQMGLPFHLPFLISLGYLMVFKK